MNSLKAKGAVATLGLLATLSLGTAWAESNAPQRSASIAFANHGGIWNWEADRDKGLWVQANDRQWYYATFMGPCSGLDFANAIGFDTGPIGSLDRWSSVLVPRWGKCTFRSFEPSDGPPKKHSKT